MSLFPEHRAQAREGRFADAHARRGVGKIHEARTLYTSLLEKAAGGADDIAMAGHYSQVADTMEAANRLNPARGGITQGVTLHEGMNSAHRVSTALAQSPAGTGIQHSDGLLPEMQNVRASLDNSLTMAAQNKIMGNMGASRPALSFASEPKAVVVPHAPPFSKDEIVLLRGLNSEQAARIPSDAQFFAV